MSIKYKAIRTGITIMVCLLVSYLFKIKYPFYVALPAFSTIQSTVSETYTIGRNRLVGSMIGAIWGIILALIKPGDIFLTGFGIMVLILFCDYIKWTKAASFAVLIFISVMVGIRGQNTLMYSFNRLLYTLVGILIVFLVNTFIFRINELQIMKNKIKNLKMMVQTMLKKELFYGEEVDIKDFEKELDDLKSYFDFYQEEKQKRNKTKEAIHKLNVSIDLLMRIFHNIVFIDKYHYKNRVTNENLDLYTSIFHQTLNQVVFEQDEDSIVYNFHLNKVLKEYNRLVENIF